jgi:cytochrome c peroxidase
MVRMMAKHQLGKDLSDREVREIETFLKALTSPLPEDFIEKPDLPPMAEDAEFPKLEQQEA